MMALSAVLGTTAALVGLWVSWSWLVPTGAALVLAITAQFVLVWILQSRRNVHAGFKAVQSRLFKSSNAQKISEAVAR